MSNEKALIVLSHLTDNAIRHTAKNVRLEAIEDGASIRMTVSNGGSIRLLPSGAGAAFELVFPTA